MDEPGIIPSHTRAERSRRRSAAARATEDRLLPRGGPRPSVGNPPLGSRTRLDLRKRNLSKSAHPVGKNCSGKRTYLKISFSPKWLYTYRLPVEVTMTAQADRAGLVRRWPMIAKGPNKPARHPRDHAAHEEV